MTKATRALACPEPPAAEAGAAIFRRGGSALEAAIAAAFAQGVTNPLGCGVGGMAHIMVMLPGWSEPKYLNASVAIGSRATPGVFEEGFLGRSERVGRYLIRGDVNQMGYRSVMTPGFVRGMDAVYTLGARKIPWADLIAPAAQLAGEGFPIYRYLHHYYTFEGPDRPGYPNVFRKLGADRRAQEVYLPGGKVPAEGAVLRQPEYGRMLERVARDGADEFHAGGVAREMAADFDAHDGFITAEDLGGYAVQEMRPVKGTFRDVTIYTASPPSHGAILVTMLNLVEDIDLRTMEWNGPDYAETIAWATRTAFGECMPWIADPHFVTVPTDWIVDKERLAGAKRDRARQQAGAHPGNSRSEFPGTPSSTGGDGHTTHVSAAEADGPVVSITHSIGSIAGAGVMTPTLGFLYNNFLGHYNPLRGYHDSIVPGKRMGGGCPAILTRNGRPWMAIGSSGGSRLISAVFQTILNVVAWGMSIQDAVAAPRVHSEHGLKIYLEHAFAGRVADALARRGYEIELTGYMGCNQAVLFTEDGGVRGGSDPRGGQGIGLG